MSRRLPEKIKKGSKKVLPRTLKSMRRAQARLLPLQHKTDPALGSILWNVRGGNPPASRPPRPALSSNTGVVQRGSDQEQEIYMNLNLATKLLSDSPHLGPLPIPWKDAVIAQM